MLMELSIVSLLLGWVWVVIAGSAWPAPWAVLLAGPFSLVCGRYVPYPWRRWAWFDSVWWLAVAVLVALLAEAGNVLSPGATSSSRWNVQFVAGLLAAWRAWALAEGWIDRELVESELQIGTLVVVGILTMMIWIVPGAGLVPAVAFVASGLFGLGLARRAERRDPRAPVESDWFALVAGLVALIVLVALVVVAIVTPDLLLAIYEQILAAFMALLAGIGALFHWIASFFPSFSGGTEQLPSGAGSGGLAPITPVVPGETVAEPPFWLFELFLTFVGVVFLIVAGRAIYRLMKMNIRSFTLRMPRQREPAPPISTTDAFTWGGWWKQVLAWFRAWLKGEHRPAATAARAQAGAATAVAEQRSIRALYRELLGLVARAGFERQPSTTPNELARQVNQARPAASPAVSTMTDLYVRVRYGEEALGRDELSRMRNALQQARRDLTPPTHEAPGPRRPASAAEARDEDAQARRSGTWASGEDVRARRDARIFRDD
jgi:hypothetical protein